MFEEAQGKSGKACFDGDGCPCQRSNFMIMLQANSNDKGTVVHNVKQTLTAV